MNKAVKEINRAVKGLNRAVDSMNRAVKGMNRAVESMNRAVKGVTMAVKSMNRKTTHKKQGPGKIMTKSPTNNPHPFWHCHLSLRVPKMGSSNHKGKCLAPQKASSETLNLTYHCHAFLFVDLLFIQPIFDILKCVYKKNY